jgi:hypothetical protein
VGSNTDFGGEMTRGPSCVSQQAGDATRERIPGADPWSRGGGSKAGSACHGTPGRKLKEESEETVSMCNRKSRCRAATACRSLQGADLKE